MFGEWLQTNSVTLYAFQRKVECLCSGTVLEESMLSTTKGDNFTVLVFCFEIKYSVVTLLLTSSNIPPPPVI